MKKHRLIAGNQYGFQKHKTEQALVNIKNKIFENMENREYTLGLFLDLRKAFDSIEFDLLLNKLSRYGVQDIALDLLRSYLSDIFQLVKNNGAFSTEMKIKQGVPAGSILEPL